MKIYWKLAAVVVMAIVATLGISTYQLSERVTDIQDKERSARQVAQLDLVKLALRSQMERAVMELFSFTNAEYNARKLVKAEGLTRFYSKVGVQQSPFLGLLMATRSSLQNTWDTEWGSFSQSIFNSASNDYWKVFEAQMPWDKVQANSTTWVRFEGPQKEPLLAVLVKVSPQKNVDQDSLTQKSAEEVKSTKQDSAHSKILVGVVPMQYFDQLGWWSKGSSTNLYVVDHKGYALSHPQQSYVGAILSEHKLVAKLLKKQNLEGKISYREKDTLTEAKYSKIDQTNLYVVIEDKVLSPAHFVKNLAGNSLIHILALILFTITVLFWFSQPLVKNLQAMRITMMDFLEGHPLKWPEQADKDTQNLVKTLMLKLESEGEFAKLNLNKEELEQKEWQSAQQLSQRVEQSTAKLKNGLSQSLTGPLATIIGQCQLITEGLNPEAKKGLQMILSEARTARQIVEGLTRSAAISKTEEPERFNLSKSISMAVDAYRLNLTAQHIKLETVVPATAQLYSRPKQFIEVVKDLIGLAVSEVTGLEEPTIKITVKESNDKVNLQIEYTQDLRSDSDEGTHKRSVDFLVAQSLAHTIQSEIYRGITDHGTSHFTMVTSRVDAYPSALTEKMDNDWDGEVALELPKIASVEQGALLAVEHEESIELEAELNYHDSNVPIKRDVIDLTASSQQLVIEESDVLTEEELGDYDEFQMAPLKTGPLNTSQETPKAPFDSKATMDLAGKSPLSEQETKKLPPHPGTLLEEELEVDEINWPDYPPEAKTEFNVQIRTPRVVE